MTCHVSCSIPSLWMWLNYNYFPRQFLVIKEKYFPTCMSLANTERFSSNWYFSKQRQARGFGREENSHVFNLDKSHCHLWDYRNVFHDHRQYRMQEGYLHGLWYSQARAYKAVITFSTHYSLFSLALFLSSIGALVTGLHRSWFHTVRGTQVDILHWLMLT